MTSVLALVVALSLPIWLCVEEVMRLRRTRRRAAIAAARKRTRLHAISGLLSRT
jgi:peptidoglycan/LPS O-acetylase OafA/YrhL